MNARILSLHLISQLLCVTIACSLAHRASAQLPLKEGSTICIVGNAPRPRTLRVWILELLLQSRYTDGRIHLRNLANPGHSMQFDARPFGEESLDAGLKRHKPDVIIALFAPDQDSPSVPELKPALNNWMKQILSQNYNGSTPPVLVLFTPPPMENTGDASQAEKVLRGNEMRSKYSEMASEVAKANKRGVINLFGPMTPKFAESGKRHFTTDGNHLSSEGVKYLGAMLDGYMLGQHPNTALNAGKCQAHQKHH